MNTIEVFNTGGGIWLAEMNLEDKKYAVVSSDAPEYLAVYLYEKAEDDKYYPEDMISDQHKDNLDDYYKTDTHWKQENLNKVVDRLGSYMDFKINQLLIKKATSR